jgi:hypothetical protein
MNPIARVLLAVSLALVGCGGATLPSGGDGGPDGGADGPVVQCNGYCPQPNGSPCGGDCDCENKCLFGTDTPAVCADPIVPTIPCGAAQACPSGQECGPFGECQGATCSTNNECPAKQQCISGQCSVIGCI